MTTDKQRRNSENLRPWKRGESGNPKGRPPKQECLTSLLKEELERIDPADKKKRTWRQLVVLATLRLAIRGNATALKEVWERADGKVLTESRHEIEAANAEPFIAAIRLVKPNHESDPPAKGNRR